MQFKVRKIKPKHKNNLHRAWYELHSRLGKKKASLIVALVAILIFTFFAQLIAGGNFWGKSLRSLGNAFSTLEHDKHGHINFLMLGIAGELEQGGSLSDSIMIVSIDPKAPSASFMSLPRDLYIESEIGDRKVNEIYAAAKYKNRNEAGAKLEGLRIAKESISKFTGIDIQYGAVVDFAVFEEIVDTLGGIQMYVPQDIVDEYYPADNYQFQTFIVRKGLQTFNGDKALKYARSRKSTSDYSRSRRQQDLIMAIKKKASDLNLLTNADKLSNLFDIFDRHVTTDVSLIEFIALAKIAVSIDYNNSLQSVLHDDPNRAGGFLYSPAREFYGGQFVLRPESGRETRDYLHLNLIEPNTLLENAQFEILNASDIEGAAGRAATELRRLGFNVVEIGNYQGETPIGNIIEQVSMSDVSESFKYAQKLFDARKRTLPEGHIADPNEIIDIRIILGE